MNQKTLNESPEIPAERVLEHLDGVLKSPLFVPSKRSQEFLRYVVLETLEGRGDSIKERNIAKEVFGKGDNFESAEYSLVRVKAGEIRKRLSDYYQSTPGDGLKIELPLGSYVPHIFIDTEAAVPAPAADKPAVSASKQFNRRRFAWMLGGSAAVLGTASLATLYRPRPEPLELLWRPILSNKAPLVIFLPIMNDKDGELTEWTGMGPTAAVAQAAGFLTKHNHPYSLRFGQDRTFSQLREGPSLMLGEFGSGWSLRMTRDLRFAPFANDDLSERGFVDRQTKQTWRPEKRAQEPYVDMDYGIACRLFDQASRQIVLLAVGSRTFGTEGAASVLFDPDYILQCRETGAWRLGDEELRSTHPCLCCRADALSSTTGRDLLLVSVHSLFQLMGWSTTFISQLVGYKR